MSKIKVVNQKSLAEAAQILRRGGLIGMPTETVYGVAADATNGEAVARIFAAKGRPSFNPLISHFATLADAAQHVDLSEAAMALAQTYWPGPLTLIAPRKSGSEIHQLVSADLPTLAVRVPAHQGALDLIKAAGTPLAAPSANKSGSLSPTTPAHVARSLGDEVDLILAAGASTVGLESTVVDVSGDEVTVLRAGAITPTQISQTLDLLDTVKIAGEDSALKSPGQLLKHYAPRIPVRLNAVDVRDGEALLGFGSLKFMGVQGGDFAANLPEGWVLNLSVDQDLNEAAANLFTMLHQLEDCGARAIAVMSIPNVDLGIAINDRLKRAAE